MPEKIVIATLDDLIKNKMRKQEAENTPNKTEKVYVSEIDAHVVIEIPKESEALDATKSMISDELLIYTYLKEPSLKTKAAKDLTGRAIEGIVTDLFSYKTIAQLARIIWNSVPANQYYAEMVAEIKKD